MTSSFDYDGKVVVVTGATGLLGSRYTRAFLESGAQVVIADLPQSDPKAFASSIQSDSFLSPLPIDCDVSNEHDVINLFANVKEKFGKVDVIVNNAAATGEHLMREGSVFTSFEDSTLEVWNKALSINLTGVYLVAREGGKLMLNSGGGSMINVSSTYGVVGPDHRIYEDMPFNSLSSYAASKAGVHGLTRWLATYWGDKGIRVNTLVPGGVYNGHSQTFMERYSSRTPLGRMANPDEMIGMVLYLGSSLSSYCTGQRYFVDGGWTAV